jgi:EmrB/QacA subfamily drug resistance transporter
MSRSWVLPVACAGQFMVVLDVSVVNVALPAIRTDLGFDATGLRWVVIAYSLTFAGFLLLGGRAADLYGRRRAFLAGLALFGAASLAGGLAPDGGLLIAARAVQGFGAAVLSPATLTLLTATYTGAAGRTRAMGAWIAVGAGGGTAGALIGGVLTEYLSWRWILLVNVPIAAAVLLAAALRVAEPPAPARPRRLDVPGAVLATAGLALVVYGIDRGWPLLVAGLLVTAAFLAVEAKLAPVPLLPLRLFASRSVSVGNVLMAMSGFASMSMWYLLSLYLQNVRHYSPAVAGLAFLPHTVSIVAGAQAAPRLMHRVGIRPVLVTGAVLGAAGFLWQSRIEPTDGYLAGFLGPAVLMCFGLGLLTTPAGAAASTVADQADAGVASGLVNATRLLGGSLGLAVLGATVTAAATPAAGYARAFLGGVLALAVVVAATAALPGVARRSAAPPQVRVADAEGAGRQRGR